MTSPDPEPFEGTGFGCVGIKCVRLACAAQLPQLDANDVFYADSKVSVSGAKTLIFMKKFFSSAGISLPWSPCN